MFRSRRFSLSGSSLAFLALLVLMFALVVPRPVRAESAHPVCVVVYSEEIGPLPGVVMRASNGVILGVTGVDGKLTVTVPPEAKEPFELEKRGYQKVTLSRSDLHDYNLVPLDPATQPVAEQPDDESEVATASIDSSGVPSNDGTYVVRAGDSLWTIAHHDRAVVRAIRRLNRHVLKGTHLHVGMVLKLPSQDTAQTVPQPTRSAADRDPNPVVTAGSDATDVATVSADIKVIRTYVVRPGDTLWAIAKGHPKWMLSLMRLNHLPIGKPVTLHPGMVLMLPPELNEATSTELESN